MIFCELEYTFDFSVNLNTCAQAAYTKSESKEKTKSLPKSLFKGRFNLSEETFQQGLADGDFHEVRAKDGKLKYSWDEETQATVKGKIAKSEVESNQKASEQDAKAFQHAASSWTIGLFEKAARGSGSKRDESVLAIEDRKIQLSNEQWEVAKKQLGAAMVSIDRLTSAVHRLIKSMDKTNKLYADLNLVSHEHVSFGIKVADFKRVECW